LDTIAIQRCIILAAPLKTLCRIADAFGRRLEIVFHELEHEHADGTGHSHAHGHHDPDHQHDHGDEE
jgi:hypothetical protein